MRRKSLAGWAITAGAALLFGWWTLHGQTPKSASGKAKPAAASNSAAGSGASAGTPAKGGQPAGASGAALPPGAPPSMAADAVLKSPLKVVLKAVNGKEATVYLAAADEKTQVVQPPGGCNAPTGDQTRTGRYGFYLQQDGVAPVRQNIDPLPEALTFSERGSGRLVVIPGYDGAFPDLLIVDQYVSCNGAKAVALALSPDGNSLTQYGFQTAEKTLKQIFQNRLEQVEPGTIRSSSYDDAKGLWTYVTWEEHPHEGLLVAVKVETKSNK